MQSWNNLKWSFSAPILFSFPLFIRRSHIENEGSLCDNGDSRLCGVASDGWRTRRNYVSTLCQLLVLLHCSELHRRCDLFGRSHQQSMSGRRRAVNTVFHLFPRMRCGRDLLLENIHERIRLRRRWSSKRCKHWNLSADQHTTRQQLLLFLLDDDLPLLWMLCSTICMLRWRLLPDDPAMLRFTTRRYLLCCWWHLLRCGRASRMHTPLWSMLDRNDHLPFSLTPLVTFHACGHPIFFFRLEKHLVVTQRSCSIPWILREIPNSIFSFSSDKFLEKRLLFRPPSTGNHVDLRGFLLLKVRIMQGYNVAVYNVADFLESASIFAMK